VRYTFSHHLKQQSQTDDVSIHKKNFDHPLISMLANQEKKVRLFVLTRHEIKGRAIAIHADIHIGSIEQTSMC
jgi:hypothetical protein